MFVWVCKLKRRENGYGANINSMIYTHEYIITVWGSLLISERGKINEQYIHDQEKVLSSQK